MDSLRQLINRVDQQPDSILVMRQQTEQRLPAHQHDKAQLLMMYGVLRICRPTKRIFIFLPITTSGFQLTTRTI